MFDSGSSPPPVAPPTDAQPAADTLLLSALAGSARTENQHAYHKVNTATEFHRRWMNRHHHPTPRLSNAWSHAGWVEIATTLACSTTTASHLVELGVALRERLPKTRAAFAAGQIDHAKAWRLATATAGFGTTATTTAETAALGFAHRYAPAGFATAVDEVLIRTAPDEYAQLRKDAEARARRVRRRKLGMLHRIEADLTAPEAAAVWQRLREVAATVCHHDPRDAQQRLVDAYLALMHGEDHLACTCERSDCTADPTVGSRRTPLVQLTADLATVLGLRNEPAYLPGHGPIDPDLARELAHNATLQPILTELVDLAITAGLLTPEQAAATTSPGRHRTEADRRHARPTAAPHRDRRPKQTRRWPTPTPRPAAQTDTAVEPESRPTAETEAKAEEVGTTAQAETAADAEPPRRRPNPRRRPSPPRKSTPRRRSSQPSRSTVHLRPPPASPAASPVEVRAAVPAVPPAPGDLHRARIAAPRRQPPLVPPSAQADPGADAAGLSLRPVHRTARHLPRTRRRPVSRRTRRHGHPATRRPELPAQRRTRRTGRARDRNCRFPGCTVPAAQCQIDHIVAFDHDNPEAGGWTNEANLQCVCGFNHELKTVGLWHAVALPGMAILWTGPRGDRHLTLPAGGLTPVPAADLHAAGP